ncbi:hypothetical protein CVT25_011857 [Psilocybe cyanescens]|uniref:NADH:flavin oxidoreductase/NADH oxidase N-terminal domain-containing protein n=1 Tax=Psilocybe cyanescens TaxID=93625 RepID=A0A409WIY4_PSICY|nr:hypothetical protein CVT25_011857 [Psilocybe cyanescens]
MSSSSTPALFQPIHLGRLELAHRVVMAPLTRFRADASHVPLPGLVAQYYAQRASVPGTLLISEATFIAPRAGGYAHAPGIWSQDQIRAWQEQCLWALGRAAVPRQLEKELGVPSNPPNSPYVSASPIPLSTRSSKDPAPRALSELEIAEYVELYAQAAENAVKHAGFDGVEIHGANGYLIDQFLQDVSNQRTDGYGGSIENRTRFALEVLDAVVKRVGENRTGLRLSPWSPHQDMGMKDPVPTFTYLINQIMQRHPDLSYIHSIEKRINPVEKGEPVASADEFAVEGTDNDFIRRLWSSEGKRLITAGGYTRETGIRVAERKGDLIAYGRLFISNVSPSLPVYSTLFLRLSTDQPLYDQPDLPYRLRKGLPVEKGDRSTYYSRGKADPKGYTDYPFSEQFDRETPTVNVRSRL